MSKKRNRLKKNYVKPALLKSGNNELIGKVDMSSDGYGFFIPEDSKLKDIFIPRSKLNGAMHKDRVKVKVELYRGKKEANVIEIIERGFSKLIGRVDKSDHFSYVIPFVKKFGFDVYIPKRLAKDLKDDDVVICEITKFPKKGKNPEGKILRILGNLHDKGIENEIVLEKYEIRRKFPADVIKEVNKTVESLFAKAGKRTDFRDLFTVTIDGETARDFDDAISIKMVENGYILYVHIADVAHFVRYNTKLDKEAYLRGTSVYFPEFAIPMLPEELSNDACSLKPGVERLTITVEIFYNEKGERLKSNIYQSVIKSNYRLTYNYVNELIEGLKDCEDTELKNLINSGVNLLKLLMVRREEQGMIDFDLAEVEFIFNDNGDIIDIRPLERKTSHRMIEFFMVEANEAVAEFLSENYGRAVFRVHDKPDPDKLADFVSTCHIYGIETGIVDNFDSKSIQQLSKIISNSKFSYLLSSMLVKTMQKAIYSPDNIGHFGLSSSCYTHFTSPIRRYPDLIVHRLIKSRLFNYSFKIDDNYLEESTLYSSRMEQLAEDAEREIHLFKKLKFIESHVGEQFEAFINRLNGNGVFVYVEKFLITGFISIENMLGDNYNYIESQNLFLGKKTKKKLKLGDKVKVKLFRINYDYLEASFVLDM